MRISKSNIRLGQTIILALAAKTCLAQPFFNDSSRGWFFYESKPVESYTEIKPPTSKSLMKIDSPGQKAESELNMMKQQLSQASALALLYPTPENVWAYQELKTKIYGMAGVLTDQQMRNEWTKPDSYSANNATGGEGLELDRASLNHCTQDLIRKGANRFGMYLFVSKNCKYCNAQIKVLQNSQRDYGVTSMVVGFNGYRPQIDLGSLAYGADTGLLANKFGIKNDGKPVTVMLDTKTGQSQVVGYGYITMDSLNNRICRLYTKELGDF